MNARQIIDEAFETCCPGSHGPMPGTQAVSKDGTVKGEIAHVSFDGHITFQEGGRWNRNGRIWQGTEEEFSESSTSLTVRRVLFTSMARTIFGSISSRSSGSRAPRRHRGGRWCKSSRDDHLALVRQAQSEVL